MCVGFFFLDYSFTPNALNNITESCHRSIRVLRKHRRGAACFTRLTRSPGQRNGSVTLKAIVCVFDDEKTRLRVQVL